MRDKITMEQKDRLDRAGRRRSFIGKHLGASSTHERGTFPVSTGVALAVHICIRICTYVHIHTYTRPYVYVLLLTRQIFNLSSRLYPRTRPTREEGVSVEVDGELSRRAPSRRSVNKKKKHIHIYHGPRNAHTARGALPPRLRLALLGEQRRERRS